MLLWPLPSFATASGRRNDVAFRFTALTAERHGRTNPFASASSAHPSKVAQPKKGLDKNGHAFFCWLLYPTGYAARLQLREDEMM